MANDKRQTRRDVTGRRPKKDPAVYRYGIKLNAEENGQFELRFAKSGLKYKARFIKAMILDREMKVVKLDKAAMDYYIRLTNFYHQFQAIGNNYNQTVRAVKANFGDLCDMEKGCLGCRITHFVCRIMLLTQFLPFCIDLLTQRP